VPSGLAAARKANALANLAGGPLNLVGSREGALRRFNPSKGNLTRRFSVSPTSVNSVVRTSGVSGVERGPLAATMRRIGTSRPLPSPRRQHEVEAMAMTSCSGRWRQPLNRLPSRANRSKAKLRLGSSRRR
jgi:hypothetical protein